MTSGYKQGLENSAKTHAPPVATAGHMEDSKDTPGCGCSAAGMLFSATQRTPLWLLGPLAVETHPYILLQTAWVHPRGQRAPGPGKFSVPVCPSQTGRSEQCGPSQLRATGDAARRETGCYGNLRRMEPGRHCRHLESGTVPSAAVAERTWHLALPTPAAGHR